MACFYTLRLPAAPGVTVEQLFTELTDWLKTDCGFDFPEIAPQDLSAPLEVSGTHGQLTAVSCRADDTAYIALRLQSDEALSPALPCPGQMRLMADLYLEEGSDGCLFGLRLHCQPLSEEGIATVPTLTMPEILWRIAEKGLLAADSGIPLRNTPLTDTAPLDAALQKLRSGGAFSLRPLLLVREGNYALTPALASRLCQGLHVLVLSGMHPALSGLGAGSARILFPRFGVSRSVDLTAPSACDDILEFAGRLTALAVPAELPDFALLRQLCASRPQPAADYLCLNRRMAEALRFYRLKSGLTQNELAKKTNTTGLLISRLENCRPARVRESLITAIEEALHLKNREILACEGLLGQEGSVMPRPAFCPFCGRKTAETGDFCVSCGSKLV
ncbi:MAG: helix-turn-helix domain-containing protein [Clostridia bacterium]|nr:helix-turn-helix domain-containing protein [Clostridia bacterium]